MAKRKLQKFAELETFQNVLQYPSAEHQDKILSLKGNWNTANFKNDNKITLELACGKADYTLALARLNPDHNFIGIDIKGDRLWKGAKIALEEGLKNVAFVRMQIEELLWRIPTQVRTVDPTRQKERFVMFLIQEFGGSAGRIPIAGCFHALVKRPPIN